jgi:hypothetical protein
MADYFRSFSCSIDSLTVEEARWCERRLQERHGDESAPDWDDERNLADFEWSFEEDVEGKSVWIQSDECGNVEHVAAFVQEFLRTFRPNAAWWMSWADTCSKPRINSCGGGAAFVTADKIEYIDAQSWACQRQQELTRPDLPPRQGDREPIGWQIVHRQTDDPPGGMATYEIYSYEFVIRWIGMKRSEQDGWGWRLIPIFEGDLPEPVFVAAEKATSGSGG